MSRRKDRERFESMKRLNPDYRGFRGYEEEPTRPGNTPLESLVCSVCSRKRNVAVGIAMEQREGFVCGQCRSSESRERT